MSKSGREIELKLELETTAQDALKRAGSIDGFTASRAVNKTLQSIYFDTPDQALRKAKISLRVRKSGNSWVQTVKLGTGVMGGLSSPVEAEHPVKGRALDFSVIEDPCVHDRLLEIIGDAPLSECFETVMKRTVRNLTRDGDGTFIELAFDSAHESPRHKSGIALRFPRISRIRWDKPAHEADRIAALRALIRD